MVETVHGTVSTVFMPTTLTTIRKESIFDPQMAVK